MKKILVMVGVLGIAVQAHNAVPATEEKNLGNSTNDEFFSEVAGANADAENGDKGNRTFKKGNLKPFNVLPKPTNPHEGQQSLNLTNSTDSFEVANSQLDNGMNQIKSQQSQIKKISELANENKKIGLENTRRILSAATEEQLNAKSPDQSEILKIENDRRILEKADRYVSGKTNGKFTYDDVKKANYPLVKTNLRVVASSGTVEEKSQIEFARLTGVITQMLALAKKNENSSRSIHSQEGQSLVSSPGNSNSSEIKESLEGDKKKAPNFANSKMEKEKAIKEKFLREVLKKRLESDVVALEKYKKLTDEVGASFGGTIPPPQKYRQITQASDVTEKEEISEETKDELLKSGGATNGAAPFSLAGPESDRKIASIVDEVTAEMNYDIQAGILQENTESLFQRVSSVYRECYARKCVRPI